MKYLASTVLVLAAAGFGAAVLSAPAGAAIADCRTRERAPV